MNFSSFYWDDPNPLVRYRTTLTSDDGRKFGSADTAARYLDERISDWYRTVNKDTLNQVSASDCVLAQLHGGDYSDGRHALGISLYCPAFDGTISTESWIREIDKRLARDAVNNPERNSMQMEPGKVYRFTVEAEYVATTDQHVFRDAIGDAVIFDKDKVSGIELVNTHEVRDGDVYLRDGRAYTVGGSPVGGLWASVTGGSNRVQVEEMDFTADELIHRES